MKKKGIWGDIEEIRSRGEHPTVSFPKATKVIIPKRPRGRPRVYPIGMSPHRTWKMQTSSGRAMRCRVVGCQRFVPKNSETLVCSPACGEELKRYCQETLDVLEGKKPAKEYPIYYRSTRIRHRKRAA